MLIIPENITLEMLIIPENITLEAKLWKKGLNTIRKVKYLFWNMHILL